MSGWEWRTIDDVSERVAVGPFGSSIKVDTFVQAGVPVISGQHLRESRLNDSSGYNFVSAEHAARLSRALVRPGDVILTHAGTIGQVAVIPASSEFDEYIISQRQFYIRCDRACMNPEFLTYYLRSQSGQRDLLANASYSGVPSIAQPSTYVRKLSVPVPPLAEQRAIAEVLGALDDKIAANTALATALYSLIEVDYEQSVRLATGERVLSDLVSTQYGVTTSASDAYGGIGLLRVTDINKRPWVEWAGVPGCSLSDSDTRKYKLTPGDIVVARMADPGRCAWISPGDPDVVFASYLVRLRAHDPRQAPYIFQFLRSPAYLRHADGVGQGSVQRNMNAKAMVAISIPLPDADVLDGFGDRFRCVWAALSAALRENRTLAATRDALLPQLMAGKLRVRDAEEVASAAGA